MPKSFNKFVIAMLVLQLLSTIGSLFIGEYLEAMESVSFGMLCFFYLIK